MSITQNEVRGMLENVMTEEQVMKEFGLSQLEITRYRREEGLPFIRLSMRKRLYLVEDLMAFFKTRRIENKADNG